MVSHVQGTIVHLGIIYPPHTEGTETYVREHRGADAAPDKTIETGRPLLQISTQPALRTTVIEPGGRRFKRFAGTSSVHIAAETINRLLEV